MTSAVRTSGKVWRAVAAVALTAAMSVAGTVTADATPATCTVTANVAAVKPAGVGAGMWGSASGCNSKQVRAQVQVDGKWVTFGTTELNSSGGYSLNLSGKAVAVGKHKFRAVVDDVASEPVVQHRLAAPTRSFASPKFVGEVGNVWGTIDGGNRVSVWTEAHVGGKWLTSQKGRTNARGGYALPLTYGVNSRGAKAFRVRAQLADGSIVRTAPFQVVRYALPTVNSAGTAPAGTKSYTWGTFDLSDNIPVWTEVYVDGKWLVSQRGTTNSRGGYSLPLSYGQKHALTYKFRVAGKYPNGTVVRTNAVTFRRTNPAYNIDSRCYTGARVMCASKKDRKLYYVMNGKVVKALDARFGSKRFPTREGVHYVYRKSRHHVSGIYGTAMPWAMFFDGGQAVHYSSNFARVGWNHPGSGGCINIRDSRTLDWIYKQTRIGDKVVVY